MESGGPDRRKRSYPQTKSMAARTGGRRSRRASVDGGPTGVEDCARSGPVGSEVRIRVQGATMSLAMTRVKHHSWSWVGVVARAIVRARPPSGGSPIPEFDACGVLGSRALDPTLSSLNSLSGD